MTLLPEHGYKRILVISAYTVIVSFCLWLFFKYLFVPLLPFICAWVISMLIRPIVISVSRRTQVSRRAVAFICTALTFAFVLGAFTLIFGRVVNEMRDIANSIISDASASVEEAFDYVYNLSDRLPFLEELENRELAEKIKTAATGMAEETASALSHKIPDMLFDLIASLPSILLFALAFITATFYMSGDIGMINEKISLLLPSPYRSALFDTKRKVMGTLGKYIRAYIILLLITFSQLLIGFSILRVPFALTLAALISLIDILPVLGVGTVLVPWAVILLLQKNLYLGIGILLLFAVIWISRQIIEPKIVGQSIGLSPLTTLISIYIGYKLMGVLGLFILPLGVILCKNLLEIKADRTKAQNTKDSFSGDI